MHDGRKIETKVLVPQVFIRYLLSGGVSAVVYFVMAWVLVTQLDCNVFASGVAGYLTSTPLAYVLHRAFTYRSRAPVRLEFVRFSAMSLLGLALAAFLPAGLLYIGLPLIAAIFFTCVFVPATNYAISTAWVFHGGRRP